MKTLLISLCLLGPWSLLGCGARGVSLGSEELCVLDPRFANVKNPTNEPISTCATLGANVLINAGFESPVVGDCEAGEFCEFPAAEVGGWKTNSTTQVIEIWHDGHYNVPAPDGSQFAELDAMSQDTLSQDVVLAPGQLMYWALQHRGRNGIETMEVQIGPPEATLRQDLISSPADAWYSHRGVYRVGPTETLTRFELVSLSGTTEGNLVDSVVFAPVE